MSVSEVRLEEKYQMVAALDVGTTRSGYAFSFRTTAEQIFMNKNWGSSAGNLSYKTPTCVLTESGPEGQYVQFGFDAERMHVDSCLDENSKQYELYQNFKMDVYGVKKLSLSRKVKSIRGEERPLIEIFGMIIKALKDHLLGEHKKSKVQTLNEDEIRWVITIPVIWPDNSKQFMKEAAKLAGLRTENVMLALEPEVASMCCRGLEINNFRRATNLYFETEEIAFPRGKKYILIDAGGGTVDITAHEVLGELDVQELHASTGGPLGGNKINEAFVSLLEQVLGKAFIKELKDGAPQQWYTLLSKFESQKKLADPDDDHYLNIEISCQIDRSYMKHTGGKMLEDAIKSAKVEGVRWSNGYIGLSQQKVEELFSPTVSAVKNLIQSVVESPQLKKSKIDYMFLVGGFGDSGYLYKSLQQHFDIPVLIPEEAQTAVVRGAVKYGYYPASIMRKAQLTYGVSTILPFQTGIHEESKKMPMGCQEYCKNIFQTLITKGERIEVDTIGKAVVTPVSEDISTVSLTFHTLDRKPNDGETIYTDSDNVQTVGTITVHIPDGKEEVELQILFRDVDIQVSTGDKDAKAVINFITD